MKKTSTNNNPISNKKVCPVCGGEHSFPPCPVFEDEIEKIQHNYNRKVCIWGNIILECIKKDKDFNELVLELVKIEQYHNNFVGNYNRFSNHNIVKIDLQFAVDFFSYKLNCSPPCFFRPAKKTIDEWYKQIKSYSSAFWNFRAYYSRENEITAVIGTVEDNNYGSIWKSCEASLGIMKYKDGERWKYKIILCMPLPFSEATEDIDNVLTLVEDNDAKIKSFFDEIYDDNWEQCAEHFPFEDIRMKPYVMLLHNATVNGLIRWKQSNIMDPKSKKLRTHSWGYFQNREVDLTINTNVLESGIYINDGDENCGPWSKDLLYIRIDSVQSVCFGYSLLDGFYDENNRFYHGKESKELRDLSLEITKYINITKEANEIKLYANNHEKKLTHRNVIVVSQSLMCKINHHKVTPYKGVIPILKMDNTEDVFCAYIGYCETCNKFYMFESDYNELKKKGTPLCKVFYYDQETSTGTNSVFRYKSQSVLNIMGYNVRASSSQTEDERHNILKEAIEEQILSTNDIIDFLNWLIRTRNTRQEYAAACDRWNEDIKYVKQYAVKNTKTITIDSITVRR